MTKKDTYNDLTFPKKEKLCSAKAIDKLFANGHSFVAYPLRVVFYMEDELVTDNQFASVLISVSKKKFKRAVKRNRVKRLIREAYRLNKSKYTDLLRMEGKRMDIAFLYLKNELPDYNEMEKSICKAIAVLTEKIREEKKA